MELQVALLRKHFGASRALKDLHVVVRLEVSFMVAILIRDFRTLGALKRWFTVDQYEVWIVDMFFLMRCKLGSAAKLKTTNVAPKRSCCC